MNGTGLYCRGCGKPLENPKRRFHDECLKEDKRRRTAEKQAALNRRIQRSPLGRAVRALAKMADPPLASTDKTERAILRVFSAFSALTEPPPEASGDTVAHGDAA